MELRLPTRLSSAQELLAQYGAKVDEYISARSPSSGISWLEAELQMFLYEAHAVSEQMLHDLGFTGSLETMELELNKAIQSLQQEGTSFMNEAELRKGMLHQLSASNYFSAEMQYKFEQFLLNHYQVSSIQALDETINNMDAEQFAKDLLTAAGLSNINIHVDQGGQSVRGFGTDNLRGFVTGTIFKNRNFAELPEKIRKKLQPILNDWFKNTNSSTKIENDKFNVLNTYEINNKSVYQFLLLSTQSVDKGNNELRDGILDLMEHDSNLLQTLKDALYNEIVGRYTGSYKDVFSSTVQEVLNIAEPRDLFAGGNAHNKLTGLLGEIQALYYIRCLVPNARSEWVATQGSPQPHADLILETYGRRYGIQVKNTTRNNAKQEVFFQHFNTSKATINKIENGQMILDFATAEDLIYPDLFEAAAGLIAMNSFNIPYVYDSQRKRIKQANIEEVPRFMPTRALIDEYVIKARKAMAMFVTSMMYMQLSSSLNANEANTLYIIGGKLAITSYSILKDICEEIKNDLKSFQVSWIKTNERKGITIVDFFNEKKYALQAQQFTLQSSYTFSK